MRQLINKQKKKLHISLTFLNVQFQCNRCLSIKRHVYSMISERIKRVNQTNWTKMGKKIMAVWFHGQISDPNNYLVSLLGCLYSKNAGLIIFNSTASEVISAWS